ncbi:HCP-like protein [Lactarius akahatsu]|uniref:HCP-like protein n=1 Tax=Lactarius akahatsu TaxID=416441 RepID=A0AAD4QFS6_9AGAM|nr:HCP-like protein [Lactarius akahatsu]
MSDHAVSRSMMELNGPSTDLPPYEEDPRTNQGRIPLHRASKSLCSLTALRATSQFGDPSVGHAYIDSIPRSASPLALPPNNHGPPRRGPSLPSNPRPHPHPGRPNHSTPTLDYHGTYDSTSFPSRQGSIMHTGEFDDAGSLRASTASNEYNYLHAAASNVLGMAPPPPPQHGLQTYQHPSHSEPAEYQYNRDPLVIPGQPPVPQEISSPSISVSSYHTPPSPPSRAPTVHMMDSISEVVDIDRRPVSDRSMTFTADTLQTRTTKAVDLRAPPYTKQYIDDYRQRIKADPDPEAHFSYARYLIDAARKVGADAKDQRAVKKYRDALIQEALRVIKRLATQGQPHDEAQFFLANCYGTGMLGLQVDHEKAYHLYLQAAKQNHAAATYRVAVCNEIGAGTRKEPPRAAAFYRKAASLGDTAAMYKLGMILLHGTLGEAGNGREAVGWLRRAAEQADVENPHALHELALLHEATGGQVVPHDPLQAKEYYSRAAYFGYTQSQHKLGQCYEFGTLGCPVDPRRSIAWYTKAAEKGNAEAELALSGWYLTGSEGVLKQSDSEAYLWARRAANKGLAKAEYAVGYYAEVGIGIKQDVEFAKRWYMRAAGMSSTLSLSHVIHSALIPHSSR